MTITKEIAIALHPGQTLYRKNLNNADGTAVRCRVNGRVKLWKTRPDDFRIPVKYGMRACFYITPTNAGEWTTIEPPAIKPFKRGDRVIKTMGIRCIGTIVGAFPWQESSDGTYKAPGPNDRPVKWDDGSKGYCSKYVLEHYSPPVINEGYYGLRKEAA